jgi:hypothetical protein
MARPKNRSETRQVTLTLPVETHDYLVLLAELGKLGSSEADVASYLVIREVDMMLAIDYHDKRLPKTSGK